MKGNSQSAQRPSGNERRNKDYRFFVLAAVFVFICVAFCIVMLTDMLAGPSKSYEELDVRTETVAGERGRIFDRNGKLLVGNSTSYDFIFEYGAMGYSSADVNRALLSCIEALEKTDTDSLRAKDYFVLKGTYPNVAFVDGLSDKSSGVGYYFNRFLVKNSLSSDMSSADLVKYFVDKYKLSEELYTPAEITALIRIYYDMDRIGFGVYQPYVLATGLDRSQKNVMELISHVEERRIEGASFIKQTHRIYPYEGYASHILGKLGPITAENVDEYKDYPLDATVGISGCEYSFEQYLRGSNGTLVSKYDKSGTLVEQYYDPAPTAGNDVYLTIDIDLQIAAEDAMAEEIESLKDADAGAATAVDPRTGEVLVLASYPTYDLSQFNRALNGLYAPGSTYKVGSALAALEEGHISATDSYICNKTYPHLGGPTCLGTHGAVTVSDAIRVSCNIFFYYVGHEMGLDRITPYTEKLGLGVPTGIELGESTGTVASKAHAEENELEWSEFDDATGAIGQSKHAYTPLQLSVYMSSVVSHGTRYSAHLLYEVRTRTGEQVMKSRAEVADTLSFSQSTYNTLISAMRSVVTSNSALSGYFASTPAEVGGKTGTAEKAGQTDNALFSGFAPLDSPEIVASCVIEKGEAGNNAAKIVAAIFEEYFSEDSEDSADSDNSDDSVDSEENAGSE